MVNSFVDDTMKNVLKCYNAPIRTLSPLRTFWEKITLLHSENKRPKEKTFGDRLSRHYYDVYQLIKTGISDIALKDLSLLLGVIQHKKNTSEQVGPNMKRRFLELLQFIPMNL